jgi:hypothetical protein
MIEDYEGITGGDKHVWQDSAAVRLRLGGRFYDLTANGAGNRIRIAFVGVVPERERVIRESTIREDGSVAAAA